MSQPAPLQPLSANPAQAPLWLTVLLSACAGGMAWGIRGQYGHETGAMMAGVLIGYSLILCCGTKLSSLQAARAVALFTIGIGFGGQQTYGQVLGLTQDKELIGNTGMLAWGLLGTFVLGANWAGFGGLLFGIGLSSKRYTVTEMCFLCLMMIALIFAGHALLNLPHDIENHRLPFIYFSDDWSWKVRPEAVWKPRPEIWGGLLLAWLGLMAYITFIKQDRLARNIGFTGYLAGIGFPLGQLIQAGHAWHKDLSQKILGSYDPLINWWNMMEITFGTVIGIVMAVGLWLNRDLLPNARSNSLDSVQEEPPITLPTLVEILLIVLHFWLLVGTEFLIGVESPLLYLYLMTASLTAGMGIIPILGTVGGRWFPYLVPFPIVSVVICGKTWLRFQEDYPQASIAQSLLLIVALPLTISTLLASHFSSRRHAPHSTAKLAAVGLLWNAALFFSLNTVFFQFPFDWLHWTDRTHSQIIYTAHLVLIGVAATWLYSRAAPNAKQ